MGTETVFNDMLRKRISETLGEPIEEGIHADDLMFDLGMRYLRMMDAQKKQMANKKRNQLSLWRQDADSLNSLIRYVDEVTDPEGTERSGGSEYRKGRRGGVRWNV